MGKEQKVVIITGASQGIGAGLVKAYRDRNYRVVANSRSIKPGVRSGHPGRRRRHRRSGDAQSASYRRRWSASAASTRWSTMPASSSPSRSPTTPRKTTRRRSAINLGGFFRLTRRVAAEMLKQGSGHIVQITTSLVDHANSNVPSVLASLTKGGLNAATKSLAIEYAKKGIRVNAVVARRHQDADARARRPTSSLPTCIRSDAWAKSATSSTRSCSWKAPPSSPARSCTSTAARAPATDVDSNDHHQRASSPTSDGCDLNSSFFEGSQDLSHVDVEHESQPSSPPGRRHLHNEGGPVWLSAAAGLCASLVGLGLARFAYTP